MTIHEEVPADSRTNLAEPSPKGKSFQPDMADEWLAYAAFLLGFLFIRWVFFHLQGWRVSLYTALFIAVVLLYLRQIWSLTTTQAAISQAHLMSLIRLCSIVQVAPAKTQL